MKNWPSLLIPLLLLMLVVPLVVGLVRANELFVLRIAGGRLHRVRGKVPPRLVGEIADVLKQGPRTGRVRGVIEDKRARLYVEGEISPEQAQRLRNVIAQWPVARIRAG